MILDILGCVFAIIAIMYTFSCFGKLVRGYAIPNNKIFLMALGIVGTIACFFIF